MITRHINAKITFHGKETYRTLAKKQKNVSHSTQYWKPGTGTGSQKW